MVAIVPIGCTMVQQLGHHIQVNPYKGPGGGHEIVSFDNDSFGVFWSQSSSEADFKGRVFNQFGDLVSDVKSYLWPNDLPIRDLNDYTFHNNQDGRSYIVSTYSDEWNVISFTAYDKIQGVIKSFDFRDIPAGEDGSWHRIISHQITKLEDGTYALALVRQTFEPNSDEFKLDVVGQRFDAAFKAQGQEFSLNYEVSDTSEVSIVATGGNTFGIELSDRTVPLFNPSQEQATLKNGSTVVTWARDGDIWAEVDGGGAFRVNEITKGDQYNPHVVALDGDRFVISWETQIGTSRDERVLDLDAQIFRANESVLANIPVLTRAGVVDGSKPADQVLSGTAGRDTFYFSRADITGADRIVGFSANDVVAVKGRVLDVNANGIVGFGSNGLLDLDGINDPRDTVRIDGTSALRSLGTAGEGVFVYARADTRPVGAKESLLANDTLSGDAAGKKADTFFFDLGLGLNLGSDVVKGFGHEDVLVTTAKIFDGNKDGIIQFGANGMMDLRTVGGERLGQVAIRDTADQVVKALHYDGEQVQNGVKYYTYSLLDTSTFDLV